MCNNDYITRVIGVTRTFNWTITTGGADIDLAGRDLTLMLVAGKGGETEMEFTTDANVLTFTWQGTDQTRIDTYSIILWENYGETDQRRVDIHNFVKLVPWTDEQGGEYSDLEEETIDLGTSDFTEGGGGGSTVVVVDNLTSHSSTAALSANMGRELNETKQDSLEYYSEDTTNIATSIECGNAELRVSESDGGTINAEATHTSISDGEGNELLVGVGWDSGVSVETAYGYKFTYNGNEVATVNNIPSPITVDDALSTSSENPVQNKVVTTAINGKQDTINDLQTIIDGAAAGATAYQLPANGIPATDMASGVQTSLGKADTALQDAPSDGTLYGRKNAAWAESAAPMEVEVVASGTTAKIVEVGKYYLFSGEVGTLAITLPTILSTTTIKGPVLSITTGASPNITTTASAAVRYYSGWKGYAANTTYEINAIYDGAKWVIAHAIVEPSTN